MRAALFLALAELLVFVTGKPFFCVFLKKLKNLPNLPNFTQLNFLNLVQGLLVFVFYRTSAMKAMSTSEAISFAHFFIDWTLAKGNNFYQSS